MLRYAVLGEVGSFSASQTRLYLFSSDGLVQSPDFSNLSSTVFPAAPRGLVGRARTTLEPRSKVNHRTIAPEEVLAQSKIHPTSRLGSGLEVGFLRSIFFMIGYSTNSRVPNAWFKDFYWLCMYLSAANQDTTISFPSASQAARSNEPALLGLTQDQKRTLVDLVLFSGEPCYKTRERVHDGRGRCDVS